MNPAGKATVKKAAPAAVIQERAAVRVFAKQAAGVDVKALGQQFTQQIRPLLRSELLFLRSVCDMTPEQRKAMSTESNQTLEDVVASYVDAQQKMMRGVGSTYPDGRKLIQESLEKAIRKHVGPEAAARYVLEAETRTLEQRSAGVQLLVSKMDESLVLSPEQRTKISESLSKHWVDSWSQAVEYLQNNDQFFPMIPTQYVAPYLNTTQKKAWETMTKNNYNFAFNVGFVNGLVVDIDDPLADDDGVNGAPAELPNNVFEAAPTVRKAMRIRQMIEIVAPPPAPPVVKD
jgi:hypothetical protein